MSIHDFSANPDVFIKRSTFNRSFGLKTTFDSGYLVPIFLDEVLPGDTVNLKGNYLARLATPIVPIMDNIYFDTFFFAVPYRLLWDHFKQFMGEQKNPDDSIDYLIPSVHCPAEGGYSVGSLADYFGLPTDVGGLDGISALPFRAYNLIWNEWFRDENLQDSVPVKTGDATDDYVSNYKLLKRGKKKDYFTSALPWPQKGEDVTLNLGTSAPVVADGNFALSYLNGAGDRYSASVMADTSVGTESHLYLEGAPGISNPSYTKYSSGLSTDLTEASALTINKLRELVLMQRFLENMARSGSRYIEIVRNLFGVKSSDARLQRPEYLGGSSGLINVSQIPQTSSTDSTSPQGNMSAYAHYLAHDQNGINKSFEEHCLIIGLACVRADLTYQQGIEKLWTRKTRYDFYWPTFAHLGEQEVLNKEIYATGDPNVDDKVFGYQERYAEYRYKQSRITGKFRSTYDQSLDYWHLAQKFDSVPTLSAEFIEENPPIDRVIAVPSEPQILLEAFFDYNHVRPMPVRSIPSLVDHF